MKINNVLTQDHIAGHAFLFSVGVDGVKEIIEHRAQGEGDKWYYDIIMEDGRNVRLFDFYSVEWSN